MLQATTESTPSSALKRQIKSVCLNSLSKAVTKAVNEMY